MRTPNVHWRGAECARPMAAISRNADPTGRDLYQSRPPDRDGSASDEPDCAVACVPWHGASPLPSRREHAEAPCPISAGNRSTRDRPTLPSQAAVVAPSLRRRASSFHMRRMTRLARCRLWARRAPRRVFALRHLAFEVAACFGMEALLGDAGDVEHCVDASVATEVEPMSHRGATTLPGRQRHCSSAAPPSELRLAGEPERIAHLDDQRCGGDRTDPRLLAQRRAVLVQQPNELALEPSDLAKRLAVLVDQQRQPRQPIDARRRRHAGSIDVELGRAAPGETRSCRANQAAHGSRSAAWPADPARSATPACESQRASDGAPTPPRSGPPTRRTPQAPAPDRATARREALAPLPSRQRSRSSPAAALAAAALSVAGAPHERRSRPQPTPRRHVIPSSLSPRHRHAQHHVRTATRSPRSSRCCGCRTCRASTRRRSRRSPPR